MLKEGDGHLRKWAAFYICPDSLSTDEFFGKLFAWQRSAVIRFPDLIITATMVAGRLTLLARQSMTLRGNAVSLLVSADIDSAALHPREAGLVECSPHGSARVGSHVNCRRICHHP